MGADHDEVVALSHFTHGRGRIARADFGRHREVWTGQGLGRVLHDLFGITFTLLRPALQPHHQLVADIVERGKDREDSDRDGALEGVRRQPCLQTDRILASLHRHEDAADGASFSFHDQGRHRGMEQDTVRYAADKHFHNPAEIARAHCDKVGFFRGSAVENKGGWVLGFAQRSDGRSLSRQQGLAPLNDLATGIQQGLTEFDSPLQVGCLGHAV